MLNKRFFKALRVVALTVLLGGGSLTSALPAQAQLVPKLPTESPVGTDSPAVGIKTDPPKVVPAPAPITAPPAAPAPGPAVPKAQPGPSAASKPGGTHNVQVPPSPPTTYVERRMHQLNDLIGRMIKTLAPILPGIMIGVRMGLMLLVLIGYVAFHFLRQKRAALEAVRDSLPSEAEKEFGTDADWRQSDSEEDTSWSQ